MHYEAFTRFSCFTKHHPPLLSWIIPLQEIIKEQYALQVVYASGGVVIYDSGTCADGTVVYLAGCVATLLTIT